MTLKLQISTERGVEWVTWCKNKLHDLTLLRKNIGTTVLCKYYELPNNILVQIISSDVGDTIKIWGEPSGVIFHPRSGVIEPIPYIEYVNEPGLGSIETTQTILGVSGGWRDGTTILDTKYPFPLDDTDDASFVISSTDDVSSSLMGDFAGVDSLYGNLYWTNGEIDSEKLIVLSWRGTPTRHFPMSSTTNLPGFSNLEDVLIGDFGETYTYTAFGTVLYQNGSNLKDSPKYNWPNIGQDRCLILGAMQNTDGAIYIVAQSDRRNAPDGVAKPGFYLTLWKISSEGVINIDGWELIAEFNYGRNGLPWFGNAFGDTFVCSNGDKLTTTGELTLYQPRVGVYAETYNSNWELNISHNDSKFFEYENNNLVNLNTSLSVNSSENSIATNKGTTTSTSNDEVLYTLEDAYALTGVYLDVPTYTYSEGMSTPDDPRDPSGTTIACVNGIIRYLDTWGCNAADCGAWSPPKNQNGYTWTVVNDPDDGTLLVMINWNSSPAGRLCGAGFCGSEYWMWKTFPGGGC